MTISKPKSRQVAIGTFAPSINSLLLAPAVTTTIGAVEIDATTATDSVVAGVDTTSLAVDSSDAAGGGMEASDGDDASGGGEDSDGGTDSAGGGDGGGGERGDGEDSVESVVHGVPNADGGGVVDTSAPSLSGQNVVVTVTPEMTVTMVVVRLLIVVLGGVGHGEVDVAAEVDPELALDGPPGAVPLPCGVSVHELAAKLVTFGNVSATIAAAYATSSRLKVNT
jgi:hypothetical protein